MINMRYRSSLPPEVARELDHLVVQINASLAPPPEQGTTVTQIINAVEDTLLPIDLESEVTGLLPLANLAPRTTSIDVTIDGGGSVIATGVACDLRIPVAATITASRLLADQSGSIVIDIWKDTYANFPPTDADSITASAPPTISSATKSEDTTLTGWTTSIAAGSILRFNVDSCTSITRAQLQLVVTI